MATRWYLSEDGIVTEENVRAKAQKLDYTAFSGVLRLTAPAGGRFPYDAHGDASLECQLVGTSRFFFPN